MGYDTDAHGVIINGKGTYAQAVSDLTAHGTVVLNWGDQDGTLLNILLSYSPTRHGYAGGLIDGEPNKLWVGIAGYGTYAFATCVTDPLHPIYIAEKFKMRGVNPTTEGLGDLLTAIRTRLI